MDTPLRLDIVHCPPVNVLGELYGKRRWDPTFLDAYTLENTPQDVNACVNKCRAGEWLPLVVYEGRDVWAFHHLHHMDPASNSTFVSGWTGGRIRGRHNAELRRRAWREACAAITRHWQYIRIHGYCLESNRAGVHWTLDEMQCVYVGRYANAVEHQGRREAIICNTVRQEDVAHCRERIVALFPEGSWQEFGAGMLGKEPQEGGTDG